MVKMEVNEEKVEEGEFIYLKQWIKNYGDLPNIKIK